jgi:tetratricopeptide (TPR) repeat protein
MLRNSKEIIPIDKKGVKYSLIAIFLIFGLFSEKAKGTQYSWEEYVQEGRKYDPAHAQSERDVDRDKAIFLYGQAVVAEPGNSQNIKIKHRIAQLYTCYSDPSKGVYPNLIAGKTIFKDIVYNYPIHKVDALQANIGLGCAFLIQNKPSQANFYFKRVLEFNPDENPQIKEEMGEKNYNNYLKNIESVRLTSVDTIAKASARLGPQNFFEEMDSIIATHPDSPVARKAQEYKERASKYLTDIDDIIQDSILDLDSLDTQRGIVREPSIHVSSDGHGQTGPNKDGRETDVAVVSAMDKTDSSPTKAISPSVITTDELYPEKASVWMKLGVFFMGIMVSAILFFGLFHFLRKHGLM